MKIRSEDYIEEIDDIHKYRTIHNKVIVKQVTDNTVKKVAGAEIVFPTHVRIGKVAARNAVKYGEVVAVPEKFVARKSGRYQTRWDTEIEIKVGDIVWCESTAFHNSERLTDPEENLYYVIDYQSLIVAKRGTEVIMLNGRVLLDPLEPDYKGTIYIPRESPSICKVIHSGSSNRNYIHKTFEDVDIEEGDLVYVPANQYFPLEDNIWRAFGGKYYWTQKNQILGLVEVEVEEKKEKAEEQADDS